MRDRRPRGRKIYKYERHMHFFKEEKKEEKEDDNHSMKDRKAKGAYDMAQPPCSCLLLALVPHLFIIIVDNPGI